MFAKQLREVLESVRLGEANVDEGLKRILSVLEDTNCKAEGTDGDNIPCD